MAETVDIREASTAQIPFILIGDNAPIDLNGVTKVEMVRVADNGTGTLTAINTTDDATKLAIIDATRGKVGFTPTSSDLKKANSPYKVFFWVYTGATTKYAVPDSEELIFNVTDDFVA